MIAIYNNIFLFNKCKYKLNTYLIVNDNNDCALINPTIDNFMEFLLKIDIEKFTKINIVYNHKIDNEIYFNFIDYINTLPYNFDIYMPDIDSIKTKINNNINTFELDNRLELGYIVLINTKINGLDNYYSIRYKEYVFVGILLVKTEIEKYIINKDEFYNFINNYINDLPNHFFICPTIGTTDFKSVYIKKIKD